MKKTTSAVQADLRPSAGVYETVREMAIEYRFQPDQKINEAELAKRLGVSRTPVRDALNRLLNEGLIRFEKNHGYFCRSLNAADLFFLAESRRDLELSMISHVIDRASDQELANLRAFCVNNLNQLTVLPPCELARADEAFHGTLASLTRNPVMEELLRSVNARTRFMRKILIEDMSKRENIFNEHLKIVDAFAARDADAARKVLQVHLAFSEEQASTVIREGLSKIFEDKIYLDVNLST